MQLSKNKVFYLQAMAIQRYVLWGKYCKNALEKRAPYREEHLTRLSNLKEQGILITLGPTKCNRFVFGIFEANNMEIVNDLVKKDIYWKNGIWTELTVYPWIQAF